MSDTRIPTLIGFSAILMWGTMPSLGTFLTQIPPFQLNFIALFTAFIVTMTKWFFSGNGLIAQVKYNFIIPLKVWALGIFGIFGFHFFYFLAYRHCPPLMVSLTVNMWPLLTVIFSGLILGYSIRANHIIAGIMGISGVGLITMARGADVLTITMQDMRGIAEALACAFIWSLYSVLSRKMTADIKADSVGVFCFISALMCGVLHLLLEESVALTPKQWVLIILMGIGPMGIAFFTWDYGMRHGNVRTLGVLSNMGPMFGVTLLILLGFAQFSPMLLISLALILAAAFIGSR